MTKEDYEPLLRDGWRKGEGYVFVSYSSQDWDKVYPCVLELRARGINVFIDAEFRENSSSSWLHNLKGRLLQDDDCKGVVAFVSTGYLGSYACLTELIANRTDMQRREKEGALPVFYIALEEALSTPQKMSQHIYSGTVKKELRSYAVKMEPEECTTLENYLFDCHLARYPDRESIRQLLLDPIKNRFSVATTMCDLIFSDTKMMPSIQPFVGAAECAELLTRNFVNEKNESIELPVLEELRQETLARLGRPEGKDQPPEGPEPKTPETQENPEPPKVQPASVKPEQTELGQLKASAEGGDASAQNKLGRRYEKGEGVEQDWSQAAHWYRKAAEQGYKYAQYNLGRCYANGQGVEKDWKQAAHWYQKSANQGYSYAQYNLGLAYGRGLGAEKDWKQAVHWYRKAADQGYSYAQYELGVYYALGWGVEQDRKQAVDWYRKSANQGLTIAQYVLGKCYADGEGVEQDWNQAAHWYRKAADQGYAAAQFHLGTCYNSGLGVEKDFKQAIYWLQKAAEQGNWDAQINLGSCYYYGQQGVKQDLNQAAYWYRMAADKGNAFAQNRMGQFYENGWGVERDLEQAIGWYRKAARGNDDAKKALVRLLGDDAKKELDKLCEDDGLPF